MLFTLLTEGKSKLGANYWTGGKKFVNYKDVYGWCADSRVSVTPKSSLPWALGRPVANNYSLSCLQMNMNKKDGKVQLFDRSCSFLFSFACEVTHFSSKTIIFVWYAHKVIICF
jgi:hypothetical protein